MYCRSVGSSDGSCSDCGSVGRGGDSGSDQGCTYTVEALGQPQEREVDEAHMVKGSVGSIGSVRSVGNVGNAGSIGSIKSIRSFRSVGSISCGGLELIVEIRPIGRTMRLHP